MYLSDAAKDLNSVYLQISASFAVQIASQLDRRPYTLCTVYGVSEKLMAQSYSMQVYKTAALMYVMIMFFKREPATLIKQEARPDS